jgi:hypothetical protein
MRGDGLLTATEAARQAAVSRHAEDTAKRRQVRRLSASPVGVVRTVGFRGLLHFAFGWE